MDERQRQSLTISAKTVNEAIAEAEQQLGLSREELDITVINEGSRGFLGMGAEAARILAVPKAVLTRTQTPPAPAVQASEPPKSAPPVTPRPRPPAVAPPVPPPSLEARHASDEEETTTALRTEFDDDLTLAGEAGEDRSGPVSTARAAEVAAVAAEVLQELLTRMEMPAEVRVRSTTQPITLDISGENLGLLIGRHGDTLSSLQYLVNVIVGRRTRHWSKIVVDVEGYRARREDALRSLAERQADRVRRGHREVTLDYMPARERRIVHLTLQNSPDVSTHSIGDEPYRRVVIAPKA